MVRPADPEPAARSDVEPIDYATREDDPSRVRREVSRDDAEKACFPGTIGAYHADELCLAHTETKPVRDRHTPEPLANAVELEQVRPRGHRDPRTFGDANLRGWSAQGCR